MIKSMTGYGKADYSSDTLTVIVEIKTLNSKNLDIFAKIPKEFSEKEIEIRNLLEKQLERGKITVTIDYQNKATNNNLQIINENLFKTYYQKLKKLAEEVSDGSVDLFRLALYLPEVITTELSQDGESGNWPLLEEVIHKAINRCDEFRQEEGEKLLKELESYIRVIGEYLVEVERLDPERIEQIKSRIENNLEDLIPNGEFDKNRFEQELIYYLEKLDISEEKVRLKSHLDYFLSEMKNDRSNGKKLNFISQEIGREINTIGSKANFAPITRHVVLMKDNLEKIKEQILNVL